jgi:hypothetical protein
MPGSRTACLVVATLALAAPRARADQVPEPAAVKQPPAQSVVDTAPDEELLEFLGGLDAEGEEWTEYLTDTDIAQVAEAKPAHVPAEVKKDE